jgi:hypothetical protein
MKNKSFLLLVAAAFLFTGCEKIIDFNEIPKMDWSFEMGAATILPPDSLNNPSSAIVPGPSNPANEGTVRVNH